ncbi:short-chain alcohol dehydrogenase-like protein [Aquipluma nitroreducens]|uniref:Short-chain alcohol dehydrogenase-like protein n=1 Tax=Aquipluma nitroreducens TaxID=2010828 RepID=A0A5K7SGL0_9BACT|nr:SDR family oxidoreductase [Aquipluma nitroreducens]BBE20364.1 short-chain alcohol dehydrogenase-like protein [Aquipluma nitroreducens]
MTKIALVTGGSRGIGRAIVLSLAQKGIDIVFTYKGNETAAAQVIYEVKNLNQKAKAFQLDTGNIRGFDAFINTLSQYLNDEYQKSNLDFLINNAGIGLYGGVADTTEETFDAVMNVNFKGVYFLTQKMLPLLNDGGSIVNVSSSLTRVCVPNVSVYASIKSAIETYTKYLANELGKRRITANVVAPGATATDFADGATKDNEERRKLTASTTALGRVGEPEDIGGVVAFLCSEEAKWVNAQRIEASGGAKL